MKRILLISGELSLRGASLYTVSLARELKLRGHKVAVLCPGGLFEGLLEDERVTLLRAPIHTSFWRNLLYVENYSEIVRRFAPNLIHVQHQDLATIGALVSRRTRIPFVMSVHTRINSKLRFPFGNIPSTIAVSEDVRQSLVTAGQVPRERIEVVPNGVSASLSALEDRENEGSLPIIGTVNRIDFDRGLDLLLRAARRVLDAGTAAYFLIIGEGPAEKELRQLARKLKLTEHLTIALPRTRVAGLFRPMDIYVSASNREGHGIFLMSAMAQARPVIATGVGGVLSFLRDGENGRVVPRGDVEALAGSITESLQDREGSREMAHEGFRDVRERFPLHTMIEKTASCYERV